MNELDEHSLNVVVVQYYPEFNKIDENIKKLEIMLEKYKRSHLIDLIVFPEMALTGYVFDSLNEIQNSLEEYNNGKTFDFCSKISKKLNISLYRLNCYVFCGFPEKCVEENKEVYYNSYLITDRDGTALPSYKKTFLYETDKVIFSSN